MPFAPSSFLLLVVRPGAPFVASLLLSFDPVLSQKGLDLDYRALPPAVCASAQALQRSIGAAVERLALDLYASRQSEKRVKGFEGGPL